MGDLEKFKNVIETIVRKYDARYWQDIRQECYLKFYEIGNRYEDLPYYRYYAAMSKAMSNAAYDAVMREMSVATSSLDEIIYEDDNTSVTFADIIADPRCIMSQFEASHTLDMMGIPKRDRRVLELYYVDGYSPRDIEAIYPEIGLKKSQIYNIINKY